MPTLVMDQSIHRHNSVTMAGMADREALGTITGGEYSVFAMNRNRQRFIDVLTKWQATKDKKEQRRVREIEKESMVRKRGEGGEIRGI